jgi:hypothetical protein
MTIVVCVSDSDRWFGAIKLVSCTGSDTQEASQLAAKLVAQHHATGRVRFDKPQYQGVTVLLCRAWFPPNK